MLTDQDLVHYERINLQRQIRLSWYVGSTVLLMAGWSAVLLTSVVLFDIQPGTARLWWAAGWVGCIGHDVVREIWLRRKEYIVLHALTQQGDE